MLFMVSNAATTRRPKVTVVPTPHNEKEEEELDDTRKKIMQRLSRAVCIDDAQTIKSVLQEQNENTWVDINHPDELGITLLIHAACFNSLQVIRPLLEAGAKIDKPDKKGWTALLWAINNHHIDMVKLLLDCGASCDIKTSKGYTIHRWVDPKDETMFKILPSPPMTMTTTTSPTSSQKIKKASLQRKQESSSPSLPSSKKKKRRASTIPKLDQVDLIYFQADMFGYAGMTPSSTTKNTRRSSTISHTSIASKEDEEEIEPDKDNEEETEESSSEDEDLEGWEGCIRSIYQFDWNKCLPDQMFVFCQDDMSHILDIAIHDVKLPLPPSSSDDILFCTANIIFLCCRFAHYHSKRDLLQAFLTLAINKMAKAIKANPRNIDSLSYWIANTHRLFQYLRRDQGLVDTTRDEQQRISHLLSEAFSLLVSFTQKRLDKLIEPALLEYEEIAQEQPIDFVEDMTSWQRFFRRSSTSSVTSLTSNNNNTPSSSRPNSFLLSTPAATPSATIPTPSSSSPSSMTPPSTLTSIITSITQTMEGYDIHYKIKEQLIMQCLQYIASQGFQRLLANKKYLCRSRAIHVRMNVSSMEEWIRHTLGHSVYTCFQPLAQLLQLLQCVSQLHDLLLFQDTTAGFDLLEPAHIRRCVLHYRYEINEPQLPEGVFTFVQQSPTTTTTTTTSLLSPRNSICSNHTTPSSHSHSNNNSRNPSLDMSSSTRISTDEDMSTADWLVACNHSSMGELIVPTEPLKRDHGCVPSIPEVWMFKLDKK
ncbi:hypothetical protein BDA99DRAFT_518113 [Phascolomyces articulosus]|uniref:Dilute domain-containing protein n=1 Tax=Phascolomyces articulosus TaxID=60185 RepID=A0AAD5PD08_9FUNG|nr:hypothetical protein BDA99DRAFT_518113 [Phascolomyces articulosus]